jgi:hypothetical protein
VLSPRLDRGKDRWSAPEPTAGKLSVLSAGPPPSVPALRGLPGWLAAVGPLPHVVALCGLLGWLAAVGPLPHVVALCGLLGWLAVGDPGASAVLVSAGGTARKESVISQGGTPVFGRVLSVSGFATPGFKESVISQGGTPVFGRALPVSGFATPGVKESGFAAPGLAAGGSAAPAPCWPPFA